MNKNGTHILCGWLLVLILLCSTVGARAEEKHYQRSEAAYTVPDVTLIN